ncbi:MAG: FAD:protein FMN transferase [Planctomycetota bacterium]
MLLAKHTAGFNSLSTDRPFERDRVGNLSRCPRRPVWLAACLIALLICLGGPAGLPRAYAQETPAGELVEWDGKTMGPITYKVIVVAEPQQELAGVQQQVTETLDRINSRMSTYRPESEVTRFNRSESTEWFEISEETARVVQRAQELSRDSGGAFDITVKPLVELWNFGAGRGDFKLPDEKLIRSVREQIGWQKLEVRLDPPSLRKSDARIQIDLSAIAKGYAVDAVAANLEAAGFKNYFVEIGGEAVARGRKPDGSTWRVGVERPQDIGQSVQRVVELQDRAIATSGDYRNFAIVDGQRYSHEIDPSTGWLIRNQVASVSIIAPDCMTADGLATAVMVLGPKKSEDLLEKYGAEVYFLKRSGKGFSELASMGFPAPPADGAAGPLANFLPVFLGTLLLFVLAVVGLLSGVLLNNKPLKGSCGGMSAATGESSSCGLCGGQTADCQDTGAKASG